MKSEWMVRFVVLSAVVIIAGCTDPGISDDTGDSGALVSEESGGSSSEDGSTRAAIDAEEYVPPIGPGDYLPQENDGPGPRRILLATSNDGRTFTCSGVVLSDQTNTPNIVVLPSGRVIVYYTGFHLDGGTRDGIGAASSDDGGESFRYYKVDMRGWPQNHAPIGDPEVVVLSDGTFRMYVTNGNERGRIEILSATSSDGFHFDYEGVALEPRSADYKDSLTAKVGNQYVMFVLKSSASPQMKRATSPDGRVFTDQGDASYLIGGEAFVLSNWVRDEGGQYRVLAFRPPHVGQIRAFATSDGATLTAAPEVMLSFESGNSQEKSFAKDAAIGRLGNGTWLMAYVSEIP